jgi:hypothetical protein
MMNWYRKYWLILSVMLIIDSIDPLIKFYTFLLIVSIIGIGVHLLFFRYSTSAGPLFWNIASASRCPQLLKFGSPIALVRYSATAIFAIPLLFL